MSYRLPKEGKTPPAARSQVPTAPPRESLITIGQFAVMRSLKNKLAGFKHECKPDLSKRTLSQWDALWTEYWNKPVRG